MERKELRKLPKPTYLPIFAQLLLQVMLWVTEGRVTSNPEVNRLLAKLPLAWMWTAVGAFTIGFLLQDCFNPESWARNALRDLRGIFSIGSFLVSGFQDGGHALRLQIISRRNMRSASIAMTFTAVEFTTPFPRGKTHLEWLNVQAGEGFYLPIASVSAPMENHGPTQMVWWGTDQELCWGQGDRDTRNQPSAITRIDIEVRRGWRVQRETIHAVCRNDGPSADFLLWQKEDHIIYVK